MQTDKRWKLLLKALIAATIASGVVAFCFVEWFDYYINSYMPADYLTNLALHPDWFGVLLAFCFISAVTMGLGIPISMLLQVIKRPGITEHMFAAMVLMLPLIIYPAMNGAWVIILEVAFPGLATAAIFWLIRRPDRDKPLAKPAK